MKKTRLAWLMIAVLLLSACTQSTVPDEEPPAVAADQAVSEWPYDVSAEGGPSGSIPLDAVFKLTSDSTIETEEIESRLSITPEIEYEIIDAQSNEVVIKPLAPLEKNKVYTVKMKKKDRESEYTWAFQTEKDLKVLGSIPGNRSEYVPVISGIEIRMNATDLENPEEYFSIEPAVEGQFSSNGYSLVFIPDNLEHDTTYTVTLEEGLKVKGSEMALEESYTFTFTTEPKSWQDRFTTQGPMLNYTSSQGHFVPVFMSDEMAQNEFQVEVLAYDSTNSFLTDLKSFDQVHSFEKLFKEIPDSLENIHTFTATPEYVEMGYMSYYAFVMPESLDQGYYLVKITYEGRSVYTFIQVSDLLVYNGQYENEQMFWILNTNQQPISQATITLDGGENGQTGSDGVAIINYSQPENQDYPVNYAVVEAAGYPSFVMRSEQMFYRYMMDGIMPYQDEVSTDYWNYLFFDRSTFLPTDRMQMFGYLMPKKSSSGRFTLSLISNIGGKHVIEEKSLRTDQFGTFTDSFEWTDYPVGWYSVEVREGDVLIARQDFHINTYTKPLYKLEGAFDKEVVGAGESVRYDFISSFYDGTPAQNMAFDYYLSIAHSNTGFVKTDENGNASIEIEPAYETTSWRPVNAQIEVYNRNAEDFRVTAFDRFIYLPKEKMIELNQLEDEEIPTVEILGHVIDPSKYKPTFDYSYEDLRGEALNETAKLTVTEIWYEQVETGQVYDYINKVTKKTYDYVRHTEQVENRSFKLTNGSYVLELPYAKGSESSFEVEVTLGSGEDKVVERRTVNNRRWPNNDPFAKYYSLRIKDDKYEYGLGEMVEYYLDSDGPVEEQPNDRLLVMHLQDGLIRYEVKEDLEGEFIYQKDHMPNMYIQGVYAADGQILTTAHPSSVRFDYKQRALGIELETDQADYRPGDEVTLSIKTTDVNGQAVSASVNVSIVDEAYFTLYSQNTDMLGTLYRSIYGTGIISEYTSSQQAGGYGMERAMAEGGGPASGDFYVRSDLRDTANFMTVETGEDGTAEVTLKLPDNLTSWRITAQGVDQAMEAGTQILNVNAKLPFYVVTILSDLFITGDQPSISLRGFGDAVESGDPVSYRVELSWNGGEKTLEEQGTIGTYTGVDLGQLEAGDYTLTTYAWTGELRDALEETFTVVDSTVRFDNFEHYDLTRNMDFDPVYSDARLTFYNQNESAFFNALQEMRRGGGNRVDQRLTAMTARAFVKKYFEKDLELFEESLTEYQNYDGGIVLLPYSDSDAEFSARVALMKTDKFDDEQLKSYFYNILYNAESDQGSVVNALAGLATYMEPVLSDIQSLMESEDLTARDRIMLGLGLAAMGDKKGADEIFAEIYGLYEENNGALSENAAVNDLSKALLMGLASDVGAFKAGDDMFEELYEDPSDKVLAHMEMMRYLENRDIMNSDQIQELEGGVDLRYGSVNESIDLFGFETYTLTLTSEELASLQIRSVDGNMGVDIFAVGGLEDMIENQTDEFSLTRTYSLGRIVRDTFEQSENVKVTLDPAVSGDQRGSYEVTDFIPAGFRFVRVEKGGYWHEENGQQIVFHYHERIDNHEPIVYYIQAVMPGVYTSDHAVIVKNGEQGTNYTEQQVLTVQ